MTLAVIGSTATRRQRTWPGPTACGLVGGACWAWDPVSKVMCVARGGPRVAELRLGGGRGPVRPTPTGSRRNSRSLHREGLRAGPCVAKTYPSPAMCVLFRSDPKLKLLADQGATRRVDQCPRNKTIEEQIEHRPVIQRAILALSSRKAPRTARSTCCIQSA